MALTKNSLFLPLGIAFGVILLGGLGYSVMSGNRNNVNTNASLPTSGPANNPYVNVEEETKYNTEVNQNIGGSRKRKGKGKKKKSIRKGKKH
jgi:flagellar basal body-associated protein FliL